jgi:hypothetical protein
VKTERERGLAQQQKGLNGNPWTKTEGTKAIPKVRDLWLMKINRKHRCTSFETDTDADGGYIPSTRGGSIRGVYMCTANSRTRLTMQNPVAGPAAVPALSRATTKALTALCRKAKTLRQLLVRRLRLDHDTATYIGESNGDGAAQGAGESADVPRGKTCSQSEWASVLCITAERLSAKDSARAGADGTKEHAKLGGVGTVATHRASTAQNLGIKRSLGLSCDAGVRRRGRIWVVMMRLAVLVWWRMAGNCGGTVRCRAWR